MNGRDDAEENPVNLPRDGGHPSDELLATYARGAPPPSARWSVEAHTMTCGRCRNVLGGLVRDVAAQVWERVDAEVDAPRPGTVERLLRLLGVPDSVARLLAATPSLQGSWLLAVAFVLLCAALVSGIDPALDVPWPFLVVAPLVPLVGIAVAFGPGVDPTYEIGLTTPFDSFRLVLLRTLAVLAASTAVSGLGTLLLRQQGLTVFAWLLPALALTGTALLLASRVRPVTASVAVGLGWVLAVTTTLDLDGGTSVLFAPPGQAAAAALAVTVALALSTTRARFDDGHGFGSPTRFTWRHL